MIALYLRLSSADGDLGRDGKDESNSIENQRELLMEFLKHKKDLAGEVTEYIDDGYTGTNFDRPAFKRMIEDMKRGTVKVMLTKDLSRLGRNYIEVGDYMEQIFPMLGVRYIAVNSNYDSNDYIGSTIGLDMSIMNLVNNLYSKDLSKKISSSRRIMWKSGRSTAGRLPYGYIHDADDRSRWVIDPEPASVVRRIFEMAADGMTLREIAGVLNSEKILTPGQYRVARGHLKRINHKDEDSEWLWDYRMVWKILTTSEYTGVMINGKVSRVSVGSKQMRTVPDKDRIRYEGHHEAIVSDDLYSKAQKAYEKRGKSGIVNHDEFPLKDVLYCGNCGLRLHHKRTTSETVFCRHKHHTGEYSKCSDAAYSVSAIKSIVSRALYDQLILMSSLSDDLEDQKRALPDVSGEIRKIDHRIETLQAEKTRAYEVYAGGILSKEEYISKRDDLKNRISELQADKDRLSANMIRINDLQEKLDHYAALAGTIKFADGLSREQVNAFIERVNIFDEEHIEIKFKFEDLLKQVAMETREEDAS